MKTAKRHLVRLDEHLTESHCLLYAFGFVLILVMINFPVSIGALIQSWLIVGGAVAGLRFYDGLKDLRSRQETPKI